MLGPFVSLFVGAHILLVASNEPPKIDAEATCRASENEVMRLFSASPGVTYNSCVRQENEALELIKKNWASYPAAAKAHCVQPGVYMPSYVEWLTCFEMERDVGIMRAEEAKAKAEAAKAQGTNAQGTNAQGTNAQGTKAKGTKGKAARPRSPQ
jgi:hypothetical protein